nr:hypothetical protein GCM10025732_43200 [Glycomyces mayteni]
MTESENPALPDEDRLDLPAAWSRFVKPRRGGAKPRRRKAVPDKGRELLAKYDGFVRATLSAADGEHGPAGLAFLDGKADVLGAATVIAAVELEMPGSTPYNGPAADAVEADHGLPFAAAAVVESLCLVAEFPGDGRTAFRPKELRDHHWAWVSGSTDLGVRRAHLAALPDADYDAVVTALAAHRTDPAHRLAVSLLVPDEEHWLDQVCEEHRAQQPHPAASDLLLDVIATRHQLDAFDPTRLRPAWVGAEATADLLHRLGADAFPVIEAQFTSWCDSNERKILHRALAIMPSDEALGMLLDRVDDPQAITFAMEAAARFPQRALRAVAVRLPDAEPAILKRLTALLHSDPMLLGPALAAQDEDVRAAIEAATATADAARLPAAPADELPALLTAPPWSKDADTGPPVVVKGLVPPPVNRVEWAPGEREEAQNLDVGVRYGDRDRDWAEEAARFAEASAHHKTRILALAPADRVPDAAAWDPGTGYTDPNVLRRILANHGEAVANQVALLAGSDASLRGILLPVVNLTAARLAADALARLKTLRPFAFAWLDRHGPDAVLLLVPDALAKPKKPRAAAEAALRYLAASGRAQAVREAAAHYGPEAAAAIEPLADADPLMPAGVPVPDPGPWVSPAALPQLLLPGGDGAVPDRALPDSAARTAAIILGLGTPEYDYPGVAVLAETCDRASLTRFSTALFEQWLTAGAPWEDSWALTQLIHFGDDDTVHALAPLIGRWPGRTSTTAPSRASRSSAGSAPRRPCAPSRASARRPSSRPSRRRPAGRSPPSRPRSA